MELVKIFDKCERLDKSWYEDSILEERDFIVDKLEPILISPCIDNYYNILFFTYQNSTEETMYLNIYIKAKDEFEGNYFKSDPMFINNMMKNTEDNDMLKRYIEFTKDADHSTKIYNCDMIMTEESNKPYFLGYCYDVIENTDKKSLLRINLHFNRDIFIKTSLYLKSIIYKEENAINVFFNPKLNNLKFSTVNHIKLDDSTLDHFQNIVLSHYTCGNGPEIYKFIALSKRIIDRKLRKPTNISVFNNSYSNSFVATEFIYEPNNDCLYLIYESKSDITGEYKETKILRFYKDMYNKLVLVNNDAIYEKEKDKDE